MTIITFDRAAVLEQLKHSLAADRRAPTFAQREELNLPDDTSGGTSWKVPQGLWLVGDNGVYLLSNGRPGLPNPDASKAATKLKVVYANEINPETMAFDDWWAAKNAIFGGDDGCDFIAADDVMKGITHAESAERFTLDLSPSGLAILACNTPLHDKLTAAA